MTDELKPVRCGCGGEAKIDWLLQPDGVYMTGVYCENCGTKTIPFWSEDKDKAIDYAVTTWNRAMGERTAKVESQYTVGDHGKVYEMGVCGACGAPVIKPDVYCSECGVRLDWSE